MSPPSAHLPQGRGALVEEDMTKTLLTHRDRKVKQSPADRRAARNAAALFGPKKEKAK